MATTTPLQALGVQRPHRADARRNFDLLVAAARESFAEHGSDASLDEIAKRAGVGIGTLYRNFPTREALIETVYIEEVEALVIATESLMDLDPKEAFDAFVRRFVEYVGTKRVLIAGMNSDSEVLFTCRGAMYNSGTPILERAQQSGDVRDDVSIEEVVRLLASVAGAPVDEDQRQKLIALAVDGLRTSR